MKKTVRIAMAFTLAGFFAACNSTDHKNNATPKEEQVKTKTDHMKNLISIVEIPVSNFPKAVAFYQAITGLQIGEADMQGTQMGILPNEQGTVNVVLVKGPDYAPSASGTVVYLDAGEDLQSTLDKIEPNGGKILVPKTEISPEMGFFALFTDTEGNKIGLHSNH